MIIVNFSTLANVPPQNVHKDVLAAVLYGCHKLLDESTYDELSDSLREWEYELIHSEMVDDDWYTRALVCICLRGLRGESRPNILNISE